GPYSERPALVDALASFVATTGARGVVVFDGAGDDGERGPLSVRFAPNADTLLERLAAEHRERELVVLVSSDLTVLEAAGRGPAPLSPRLFFRDFVPPVVEAEPPHGLTGKLDKETREQLERLRRGE